MDYTYGLAAAGQLRVDCRSRLSSCLELLPKTVDLAVEVFFVRKKRIPGVRGRQSLRQMLEVGARAAQAIGVELAGCNKAVSQTTRPSGSDVSPSAPHACLQTVGHSWPDSR